MSGTSYGIVVAGLLALFPCRGDGAYDPLATGAAPESFYLEIPGKEKGRVIPVKIFVPGGEEKTPCPVILFSHGLGGSREGSNFLGRHWSSRGYVTVFLQHPGSDEGVWKGKGPAGGMSGMKGAADAKNFFRRIEDVEGVLDALEKANADEASRLHGRLDMDKVGMSGHSFGAKTTQAVSGERSGTRLLSKSYRDPRIDAALPMSPSPTPRVDPGFTFGKVDLPWLCMTGTHDGAPAAIVDTKPEDRLKVYPALPPGDKYELVLDGAEHSVFTERALRGESKPRHPNHHRVILAVSTAFWDCYLKGDVEAGKWLKEEARSVMEEGDRWQWK
jgi:predicted dienelactone hydrolase